MATGTREGVSFDTDAAAASRALAAGRAEIDRLPTRMARSEAEQQRAEAVHTEMRATRVAFLRRHAAELYARLTDGHQKFVRIEDLVFLAAEAVPGLTPTRAQIAADREHLQ